MPGHSLPKLFSRLVLLAFLSALLLGGGRVGAASGPLVAITNIQVAPQSPPRITAHVTVAAVTGIPVQGLEVGAFHVIEDAKPVQNLNLASAPTAADGVRVALALDTSGSMAGQPLQDLKDAAGAFVRLLAPQDLVAAFGFGGSLPSDITLTADHDAALSDIARLRAGGDTPLYDAAFAAVSEVASGPSGRRAVVVLTDGEDTNSAKTLDDAIHHAQDANVPVFTIGLGDVKGGPLQRLADTTGGLYQPAQTSSQLAQLFSGVANQLRQEYVLTFDGDGRNVQSERELAVTVNVNGQSSQDSRRYAVPATISQHVTPHFVTPTDGQRVRGIVRLEANAEPAVSARSATFFVDGRQIGSVDHPPFVFDWQTRNVLTGGHSLKVDATGLDGQTESATENVVLTAADGDTTALLGLVGLLLALGAVGAAIVIGRRRHIERDRGEAPPTAPESVDPVAWLVEEHPDGTRWNWPLRPGETLIGRGVSMPHIVLDDIDVSRRHAAIYVEGQDAIIRDLGPTNPSTLNGRPFDGPQHLRDGDEIVVGGTRLVFMQPAPVLGR